MFFYRTNESERDGSPYKSWLITCSLITACTCFGPTRDKTAICSIQRIEGSDKGFFVLRDDRSESSFHTRDATENVTSGSPVPMDWVYTTNQCPDNSPKYRWESSAAWTQS
ncbi:hypothetical protein V8C34DRAFT_270858 [Trichoderma compactum]